MCLTWWIFLDIVDVVKYLTSSDNGCFEVNLKKKAVLHVWNMRALIEHSIFTRIANIVLLTLCNVDFYAIS